MSDLTPSDHRLALVVVVPLVLIAEQRLVALQHVGPFTHGTRGGNKNDCDDHEGGDDADGDDFSQSEWLTCGKFKVNDQLVHTHTFKTDIYLEVEVFVFCFVFSNSYLAIQLHMSSRDFQGRSRTSQRL